MRARRWFHCKVCGVHWQVYFKNIGPDLEGLCCFDEAKIYLNYSVSRVRVFDVLYHELGHAIVFQSGADVSLASNVGISRSRLDVVEENFISIYGQAQFQTFADNGWLRLPEIPAWVK